MQPCLPRRAPNITRSGEAQRYLSGGDTVNVAREQRHLPYVRGASEPREEPPEPQRVPTVWRHAVSHRVEVPRIRREVRHATRTKHRDVVRVPMQPLRAADNLEAAE